jgi:hypothetical protein
VDTLLAEARQQLDQKVAEGKITADKRDQIAGQLEAMVTDIVNGKRPSFPGGPSGSGAPGGFGAPSGFAGPSSGAFSARPRFLRS